LKWITIKDFYKKFSSEREWLIEPICCPGSSIMIYGRQGVGKTTLMWQMAHALASGEPWLGLPVHKRGPVLFLELDMPDIEFTFLQERAEKSGCRLEHEIDVIEMSPYETFNVFDDKDLAFLRERIEEIQPIAVFVDTIDDGHEAPKEMLGDVNRLAKTVVNKFRFLLTRGLTVYSKHERKEPAFRGAGAGSPMDDKDSFTGGSGWERKVASSFRVYETKDGEVYLLQNKHRLAPKIFGRNELRKDENGLFSLKEPHPTLLMTYPYWIPEDERIKPKTLKEVFEDIAERSGVPFATIKQCYYRKTEKGMVFEWKKALQIDGG
jgi:hypothetical protein